MGGGRAVISPARNPSRGTSNTTGVPRINAPREGHLAGAPVFHARPHLKIGLGIPLEVKLCGPVVTVEAEELIVTVKPLEQPLCAVGARPKLLDLFCGAGGAAVGYDRAGFEVVGVDHRPQPRYPFTFIQADALETLRSIGDRFDAIHASPPCQRFSTGSRCAKGRSLRHPDLLTPTIELLPKIAKPWVVENVIGAPLSQFSATLCGLMFGLRVFRHRLFEGSFLLLAPSHPSHRREKIGIDGMACVVGHGGGTTKRMRARMDANGHRDDVRTWSAAMKIDWMTRDEIAQSIPPAYTQYIGNQLIDLTRPDPPRAGRS